MLKLLKELKRRKVLTTLGVYGAAVLIIIQVADIVFTRLLLPDWTVTFIIILLILGFPVVFFFSWTYDLKRESETNNESVQKSKKILLPITGFLTIVGGVFWFWYSMGDITSGSEQNFEMGIKKSIAVLDFENISGEKRGDHLCSGIRENIRSVLTKLGKLDVKSSLAIKNRDPSDLDLDYYIEGALSGTERDRNINVYLVDGKTGTNLSSNRYQFVDTNIVAYQDTIIKNILRELNIDPSENELISNKSEYKDAETFQLIGEGIYHYDNKNYSAAIKAFDSVLTLDSENIMASYHKANSFFKQNNFTEAMSIYKDILGRSPNISRVNWNWRLSEKEAINQSLCTKIELIKEDLAIMLSREVKSSRLIGFSPVSQQITWEVPIGDNLVNSPVVINNTVFLTSNRVGRRDVGAPTLYAYDIAGKELLIKDFPRDNENQSVFISILESYSNFSNDASKILLSFDKIQNRNENYWELALLDLKSGKLSWKSPKIDLSFRSYNKVMLVNTGSTELLLLILSQDIIALNNKTGEKLWQENFPNSRIGIADNQQILIYNRLEKYGGIWDPVSRKVIYKISHESFLVDPALRPEEEFYQRMDKNVLLGNYRNGDLQAVNFDGGFFNWNRERWVQNIGIAEKIWFEKNIYNRVFCLTEDDTLFTIDIDSGKIIKRFPTDRHDYTVSYDDSQNAMVLHNAEFIIGVDPKNGDQLWKIRNKNIDSIELVGNSVFVVTPVLEDSILLINTYNRDNGNLIWSDKIDVSPSLRTLPVVAPLCRQVKCDYCGGFSTYLQQYSDESLFLNLHDEIINVGIIQGGSSAIQQKDVQLQIAKTYEKKGQLDQAIKEYDLLITQDQMNQGAYWGLASIYQQKGQVNKAAQSLVNYYELILPESTEGIKTVNKLKSLNVLKWETDLYWDEYINTEIAVDNERVFLFLDNKIRAYRINSSALIWSHSFENKTSSIVLEDVTSKKHIFYIKKDVPDVNSFYLEEKLSNKRIDLEAFKKTSKYYLAAMDKKDSKKIFDVLLDIPGESDVIWMGVKGNKIFIQSIVQNKMFISTYDLSDGKLLWGIYRDVSNYYTSYDLTPAFLNNNLLLPLDTGIEFLDDRGNIIGVYADEDMDNMFVFNESCIQNNTLIFIIQNLGYEYVIVDLENFSKIAGGALDLDNPKLGSFMSNMFIDISSSGIVTAYTFDPSGANEASYLWDHDFKSSLELVEINKNNIYLLDQDNNYIYEVEAKSGIKRKQMPLLWHGKNVELSNNYFIVQSANKLYLISI